MLGSAGALISTLIVIFAQSMSRDGGDGGAGRHDRSGWYRLYRQFGALPGAGGVRQGRCRREGVDACSGTEPVLEYSTLTSCSGSLARLFLK